MVRGRNALNVRGYVSRHAVDRTRSDLVYEMFQKRRRTATIFSPINCVENVSGERRNRIDVLHNRVYRLQGSVVRVLTGPVYWAAEIAKEIDLVF